MMILVTGASSSGKSALAERLAQEQGGALYYIATMHAYDAEGDRRIARHREMRAGKGFVTLERYTDIGGIEPPSDATLLLECMSNLLANEMYDADGAHENSVSRILSDAARLEKKCRALVIVSNEIFADGVEYDAFCTAYVANLGSINCGLAAAADTVIESVVGLPVVRKKGGKAL